MRLGRVAIIAAVLFFGAFGVYLGSLYQQLRHAFFQQDQFTPTRIFSDITRIAPPMPRAQVEDHLKELAYATQSSDDEIRFTLHPIDYPPYLIPENHPVLDAGNQPVVLHFDGPDKDALLHSIDLGSREIPDLYLEPQLVATLSKGGREASKADSKKEIRQIVKWDDMPPQIWKAVIAVEDQHFLEHSGLDPRGLARAIWVDLRTRSFAQGGSTITQQLVKNLMARHTRNPFRKFNELFLALLLETSFDKTQILERYLNEVYLGQVGTLEVHGVAEGAEHFFGKKLEDLNLAEIALMAGLIRGPGFYSPYNHRERALERQHIVLKKMVETGQIADEEAKAALKQAIHLAPPQTVANKAPYFDDFVKAELIKRVQSRLPAGEDVVQAGFKVYTTLDMSLNAIAQQAVESGVGDLEKRMKLSPSDRLEGALACADQATGQIRALVGGRNYATSTFNRILNMKRQVGSTFKPFVYLAAILKGEDPYGVAYGPGHPAEDASWTYIYDRGKQKWTPRNYEKEYLGWIDYRRALAHSINTVTARLGVEVGIPNVIAVARALGIESDLPAVPSLSLGVAELSPIELLRAYTGLANHGTQNELTVIRAITQDDGTTFDRVVPPPAKPAVEPGAADLITDMLTSVFTEGTARFAGFERAAAGKTGTTSHHRDAWFAGYTPQLTTVVWVGKDEDAPGGVDASGKPLAKPASKVNLTGATSALPIWARFMKRALDGEPPAQFPISPALADVSVDKRSGKLASSGCPLAQVTTEKYVKGHEPRGSGCESMWPPTVPVTRE